MHIAAGEKLNENLKFTGHARDEFLLGCLLPDVNNGYINQVKVRKHHAETHWRFDDKMSWNFLKAHRAEIEAREPIFVGYFFHLFMDGYFNRNFARMAHERGVDKGMSEDDLRFMKQWDFRKYDWELRRNVVFATANKKDAVAKANLIDTVEIDLEDLADVESVLADRHFGEAMEHLEYRFFTREEISDLMNGVVVQFFEEAPFLLED